MKRVLITGANGLIARQMATYIGDFTPAVFLTSKSHDPPGMSHEYFSADLIDFEALESYLERIRPDTIIHTAAITSVDYAALHPAEAQQVNEEGVERLAQWCGGHDCRLVHFSTDFVFDGTKAVYEEEDEPNPLSLYGWTKYRSEQLVRKYVPDSVVIRTVLVYGAVPHAARLNFPLWVAARLSQGTKTYITADQFRAPTYVKDLARAALGAAFSDYRGILHISGDERLSIMDFALKTARAFDLDASCLVPSPTSDLGQAGQRPLQTSFTNARIKALVDYRPLAVDVALRDMRESMDGY